MGRIVLSIWDRIDAWSWRCDIQRREREIQRHFRDLPPDSVVDIDKYLRAQGFLP